MKQFQLKQNPMQSSGSPSHKMSRLQANPAAVVPGRTIFMALVVTALMAAASLVLDFSLWRIAGGLWIGVAVNLINFRLIVMGAHEYAQQRTAGGKPSTAKGIFIRQLLSAGALVAGAFLGVPSIAAALIGLSMAKFAIQLDGFVNFKSQ
jgi:hypothetical protein